MKFFKEHSYDIVRIFITQIGISIFSMMLYTGAGMISSDGSISTVAKVIISVFASGFFFFLLYTTAWEWGGKDKIRLDAGRDGISNHKGLKMALFANIPNFFLNIITIISAIFCLIGVTTFFEGLGGVCETIFRFIEILYLGVVQSILIPLDTPEHSQYLYSIVYALLYIVCGLLSVLFTEFGYIMGRKEKKILYFLKDNKKYE